jgi:RNA recognition motif-containing protein
LKKLYIGNLSYETKEEKLQEVFGAFGTVTNVNIIRDRATGRSRGFGFVEMEKDDEAAKAIAGTNEIEVDGRKLTVNEARPQTNRTEGGGGSGWGRSEGRGGHSSRGRDRGF